MKNACITLGALLTGLATGVGAVAADGGAFRDIQPDTWVATDALGRRVPGNDETGPPRADRTLGLFYFLWLGAHVQGGPYDISRILAQDPDAMNEPGSPLWGPLHAPHHWGESIFGYYRTSDAGVLRKHAQMLSDAGVDVVIFDVTNQVTYRDDYRALLREWAAMRALGNRTPQVAFLTPFWDPAKVVRELWRDLYSKGDYRDLWFQWDGRPLILADPELVTGRTEAGKHDRPVEIGGRIGQSFRADKPLLSVAGQFPTWRTTNAAVTLVLREAREGGRVLARRRFEGVRDNQWLTLVPAEPVPPGEYRFEASEASGRIGWWTSNSDLSPSGTALDGDKPVAGDRSLRWTWADDEAKAILATFTFRKPQPDYFEGPTRPDMWSWLEVSPQHVFRNSRGEKEQMSVGVAQNAVRGRLGSMSEPGAQGRSFRGGRQDTRPDAVRLGLNFEDQWRQALREDPRFVFVTGWNEWIAGRFNEFGGVKLPVMFVDQFDQEHSRDIEPMRGGHGDDYYYQFVGWARRYKGARPVPPLESRPVTIDGDLADWDRVAPEFRDTAGDPVKRHHPGWGAGVIYTNDTGRNDIVSAKASWSREGAHFLVRTAGPLSEPAGEDWMVLLLDVDADARTGWLGYDFVINRRRGRAGACSVERNVGGKAEWTPVGEAAFAAAADGIELAVPWPVLGLSSAPAVLDFKWADHCTARDDWTGFTLDGDAAPNDRFNFRARQAR